MSEPITSPSLAALGWSDRWAALYAEHATPASEVGRVVRHDGTALLVATGDEIRQVAVRARLEPPTVGDWVVVEDDAVRAVLHRTGELCRAGTAGDRQLIAANVDVVLVVCGLDRPTKAGRIARTASLAWAAGATPVVVLTKADLAKDAEARRAEVAATSPGLDVLVVSALHADGIAELAALAVGRTVVLVGESGAGKSSLVNALLAGDVAATGAVRSGDAKGRHTTTARRLFCLPGGGVLVDSPGIRAVGLWGGPDGVDAAFADVENLASGCCFSDCGHSGEPGCAVAAAVADGALDAARLDARRALRREAIAAERRASPHERRRHEREQGPHRTGGAPPQARPVSATAARGPTGKGRATWRRS